jgi:hypothetical protein
MTTTAVSRPATTGAADPTTRKNAAYAGALYLITFAASLPAWFLLDPVLTDPGYIVSSGGDTQVLVACFLDMVNAVALVGTAVAVYPVVRRENVSMALGFVTSRMFEAAVIMIGVVSLLGIVTLHQDFTAGEGADAATLGVVGEALVAVRDWTFLLGPGFMACFNALLFGTLLYRSRLVPRIIPTMGLIGAPLLLLSSIATFFGHNEQMSAVSSLATLPIAAWELSVGFWMLFKGFREPAV